MRYFIINENMEKLAKDKKLRPIELMVMANIYSFYKSNKDCKESMKSFADRFGVTYPTIMKCFDNLVNKNIIVKGEKLDRNNNIWLLSDETIKAIDEIPTENKQENAKEEPKEEKTANTTPKEEKDENKANMDEYEHIQSTNDNTSNDSWGYEDEYEHIQSNDSWGYEDEYEGYLYL